MSVPPRQLVTGQIYHIYNRGIRKQPIFQHERDFLRFLATIKKILIDHPLTVLAYCLMTNHFHFLVRQEEEGAITRLFSRLCNSHAKYFNMKYDFVGALFQGRFKAKLVDRDEYFIHLTRYINLNPSELIKSKDPKSIKEFVENYRWSSYQEYLNPGHAQITNVEEIYKKLTKFKNPLQYHKFVNQGIGKVDQLISELAME